MLNLSWELLFALGAVLLGLAIAYGLFRYSRRDRRNDAVTEQAPREEYRHPERHDRAPDMLHDESHPT